MKRSRPGIAFLALLLVSLPVLAIANFEITGSTDGGAFYKIVVPDPWNGDLVIWNHGFRLAPPARVNDLGPLAELQLFEGYAIAASSYQQAGWALFKSRNDLQNMVGVFKEKFGTPKRLFLTGGSLGGLVTVSAIEDANIGNIVGAFPFCGAWQAAATGTPPWTCGWSTTRFAAACQGPRSPEERSGCRHNLPSRKRTWPLRSMRARASWLLHRPVHLGRIYAWGRSWT